MMSYPQRCCQSWMVCHPFEPKELTFEAMAFDDPLYIIFISTTGLPKCIVHSVGGTLMNLKKNCCYMVM